MASGGTNSSDITEAPINDSNTVDYFSNSFQPNPINFVSVTQQHEVNNNCDSGMRPLELRANNTITRKTATSPRHPGGSDSLETDAITSANTASSDTRRETAG